MQHPGIIGSGFTRRSLIKAKVGSRLLVVGKRKKLEVRSQKSEVRIQKKIELRIKEEKFN